jgi:SAM-dependent methyltransferase
MKEREFKNISDNLEFYENRYKTDYMSVWDDYRMQRVLELVRSLPLPETGKALDFGCGSGVFTALLKCAQPQWEICGCDISETAVATATARNPGFVFFLHRPGEIEKYAGCFDLLFTHHVLEHVYDIEKSFNELCKYVSAEGRMFHVLPCGNPGSFEYKVCKLVKNGIDPTMGNRFFFEDEGHLRRLTSEEMELLAKEKNFRVTEAYFASQYYGAIQWMISYGKTFINEYTDTSEAINEVSAQELKAIHKKLIRIEYFNQLNKIRLSSQFKLVFQVLYSLFANIARIFSIIYSRFFMARFHKKAANEWENKKKQPNGSEMFVLLRRISKNSS